MCGFEVITSKSEIGNTIRAYESWVKLALGCAFKCCCKCENVYIRSFADVFRHILYTCNIISHVTWISLTDWICFGNFFQCVHISFLSLFFTSAIFPQKRSSCRRPYRHVCVLLFLWSSLFGVWSAKSHSERQHFLVSICVTFTMPFDTLEIDSFSFVHFSATAILLFLFFM